MITFSATVFAPPKTARCKMKFCNAPFPKKNVYADLPAISFLQRILTALNGTEGEGVIPHPAGPWLLQ
jgi:hypothetical protein